MAKGNKEKNIARVKYYNCGKKGHFAQSYPEPTKVPSPTKTSEIYLYSHAFVDNSLPQWIVDMGATKHIAQDRVDFMEFHHYPNGFTNYHSGK